MQIYFIRHGKTAGNMQGRYIGRTDEGLCKEGKEQLAERKYPPCDCVIVSPMKRCIESASILYPKAHVQIEAGLRETDFGEWEGKNYEELKDDAYYQAWIDSNGTLPIPKAEDTKAFRTRCCEAFLRQVKLHAKEESIAFVVHGGTIMAILEAFAQPKRDFYSWQMKNGTGYAAEYEETTHTIRVIQTLGKDRV